MKTATQYFYEYCKNNLDMSTVNKTDFKKALTEHDNEIKQLIDEMQSKIQNSLDEYLLEHRSETEGTLKIISECEIEVLEELKLRI